MRRRLAEKIDKKSRGLGRYAKRYRRRRGPRWRRITFERMQARLMRDEARARRRWRRRERDKDRRMLLRLADTLQRAKASLPRPYRVEDLLTLPAFTEEEPEGEDN